MDTRRDVYQAIADPTRRAIITMLAGERLNVKAVADQFDTSRPAIAKHLKILEACGVILIKKEGRESFCEANFKKLSEVSDWVNQFRKFWNKKLDALDDFLAKETLANTDPKHTKKTRKK